MLRSTPAASTPPTWATNACNRRTVTSTAAGSPPTSWAPSRVSRGRLAGSRLHARGRNLRQAPPRPRRRVVESPSPSRSPRRPSCVGSLADGLEVLAVDRHRGGLAIEPVRSGGKLDELPAQLRALVAERLDGLVRGPVVGDEE